MREKLFNIFGSITIIGAFGMMSVMLPCVIDCFKKK